MIFLCDLTIKVPQCTTISNNNSNKLRLSMKNNNNASCVFITTKINTLCRNFVACKLTS